MIERAMGRAGLPLTLVPGHGWEIMAVSDLLLMASGSASLEAAILGTPMLLVYKVPWPDWILGKYILRLRINHFGLPSLVLQRRAIPEFLQREANPQNLAHSALEILTQENVREKMKEDLRLVQESLGAQGVLERIAGSLKELLHG
jgi:lipid-A-disaccharide synthase